MSSSTSALKARHYNALANSLRQLQNGLQNSEYQMDRLSDHLGSMQKLGTHSAAQYVFPLRSHYHIYLVASAKLMSRFMSVSRLLDQEIIELERQSEEEANAGTEVAGQTQQTKQ